MPKEIKLRFGTKGIDKALALASKIKKRIDDASLSGVKLSEFTQRLASLNERLHRARGIAVEEEELRGRLAPRGRRIRQEVIAGGRESIFARRQTQSVLGGGTRFITGLSAVRAISRGSPLVGAAFFASFVGGPAAFAVQVATLALELLQPVFAEREKEVERLIATQVLGQVDRLIRDFDPEARAKRDPAFRDALIARAVNAREARGEATRSSFYDQRWEDAPGALDGF